jgi:hypothetical protein
VKEYQYDPVTHQLLHADFYRVAMDKVIRVTVSVVPRGEPKGVKQQGGVLDIVHRQLELECLPADIPEHIEVDVSEMMVGQSVRVRTGYGRARKGVEQFFSVRSAQSGARVPSRASTERAIVALGNVMKHSLGGGCVKHRVEKPAAGCEFLV